MNGAGWSAARNLARRARRREAAEETLVSDAAYEVDWKHDAILLSHPLRPPCPVSAICRRRATGAPTNRRRRRRATTAARSGWSGASASSFAPTASRSTRAARISRARRPCAARLFRRRQMNGYNFTEHVRAALGLAREESARLHHEYVGTEHILLGTAARRQCRGHRDRVVRGEPRRLSSMRWRAW